MSETSLTYKEFVLPASVVTKRDVSQLVNEAERVDSELTTATVRAHITTGVAVSPVFSGTFSDFLALNKLEFEESKARTALIKQLRLLKDNVPIIHLTFAVSADIESLQKLTAWFRQSVSPQVVLEVGLQPALVAGVYIRTTNHVHDLSLRAALAGKHDLLVKELEGLRSA